MKSRTYANDGRFRWCSAAGRVRAARKPHFGASGLNGQSFAFVGYLPVDAPARAARLRELEALSRKAQQTQLLIETPYRNGAMLDAMLAHLQAGTRISVSCGLTAPGAFTRSDTVARWRAQPSALPADRPAVFALLAG